MVLLISIHEAARASTALNLEWLVLLKISIHEAARASTQRNIGGRRVMGISIHEAARASTLKKRMLCGLYGFQSTKPQGLRPGMAYPSTACKYFNPRSRKGFDSTDWPRPCKIQDFNPRSRKGFDHGEKAVTAAGGISIHEAARASTLIKGEICIHQKFQSTKPQGLRRLGRFGFKLPTDFNPRSRKGFDVQKIFENCSFCYFNPRSRKGFDSKYN